MSEVLQVKEQFDKAILQKQNVVGTGVGQKYVNGLPTGAPAILVFVEKKMSQDGVISKYSVEDMVPESLENIPTDVIEVGKIRLQAGLQQRVRPLLPGYSCGHGLITAGTLGGFFKDRDGDIVALSNNHVMANENAAKIGDLIYQPGPVDSSADRKFIGWENPDQLSYFGTLKNFVKINAKSNVQDSAIAKIHPRLVELGMVNPAYPVIGKRAAGWGVAKVGDQLQKCGRTTGHTTGSVLALHGTFTIEYDFGPAEFNDCVVSTFMSKGGDSGSVIYDFSMNAVSLLFAGSNKVTISNPIDAVRNYYGLEIWDGGTTAPAPDSWNPFQRRGQISLKNGIYSFTAAANNACYIERYISDFNAIECVVNTGTDMGATWATGLAVLWANGSMKVNARRNGQFGGYYNNDHNINLGRVKPNTDYTFRIRKLYNGNKSIVGEVKDGNQWIVVVAVPAGVFQGKANCIRIGKTDLRGAPNDHVAAGAVGTSTVRDIRIT